MLFREIYRELRLAEGHIGPNGFDICEWLILVVLPLVLFVADGWWPWPLIAFGYASDLIDQWGMPKVFRWRKI